jgi:hypothetical protein
MGAESSSGAGASQTGVSLSKGLGAVVEEEGKGIVRVENSGASAERGQNAEGLPANLKIKVDYGSDGKNSTKYQKMVGTMKDLELKRQANGGLRLMEERQYALLIRQVSGRWVQPGQMDRRRGIEMSRKYLCV